MITLVQDLALNVPLLEVLLIAACLLTILQPKRGKRETHDETDKEELS